MTTYDIDVSRTADLWSRRHGKTAVAEARKMADQYQAAGDRDGAEVWRLVGSTIESGFQRRVMAIH
jgi:hypothetical protein